MAEEKSRRRTPYPAEKRVQIIRIVSESVGPEAYRMTGYTTLGRSLHITLIASTIRRNHSASGWVSHCG